jgi:hypothetical protein
MHALCQLAYIYIFINNNSTPPGVSTLMKEPRQEMDRALKRAAKGEDLMVETASEAAGIWMEYGYSIVLLCSGYTID